jgi:P27 family predicted phage terminase small subunit
MPMGRIAPTPSGDDLMGRRGPAPKPTNLRVLHGDRKDRINDQEPVPSELEVKPPHWLAKSARAVWGRLAPDLERRGVLTAWDVEAFANYCDAVVRRYRAAKTLEREGEVVELPVFNKNGDLTGHRLGRNPWSYALKDADAQVQRWGARFGLTPSDRSQISVGEDRRDSDDDLLSG